MGEGGLFILINHTIQNTHTHTLHTDTQSVIKRGWGGGQHRAGEAVNGRASDRCVSGNQVVDVWERKKK